MEPSAENSSKKRPRSECEWEEGGKRGGAGAKRTRTSDESFTNDSWFEELLLKIAPFLEDERDLLACRGVCRAWRFGLSWPFVELLCLRRARWKEAEEYSRTLLDEGDDEKKLLSRQMQTRVLFGLLARGESMGGVPSASSAFRSRFLGKAVEVDRRFLRSTFRAWFELGDAVLEGALLATFDAANPLVVSSALEAALRCRRKDWYDRAFKHFRAPPREAFALELAEFEGDADTGPGDDTLRDLLAKTKDSPLARCFWTHRALRTDLEFAFRRIGEFLDDDSFLGLARLSVRAGSLECSNVFAERMGGFLFGGFRRAHFPAYRDKDLLCVVHRFVVSHYLEGRPAPSACAWTGAWERLLAAKDGNTEAPLLIWRALSFFLVKDDAKPERVVRALERISELGWFEASAAVSAPRIESDSLTDQFYGWFSRCNSLVGWLRNPRDTNRRDSATAAGKVAIEWLLVHRPEFLRQTAPFYNFTGVLFLNLDLAKLGDHLLSHFDDNPSILWKYCWENAHYDLLAHWKQAHPEGFEGQPKPWLLDDPYPRRPYPRDLSPQVTSGHILALIRGDDLAEEQRFVWFVKHLLHSGKRHRPRDLEIVRCLWKGRKLRNGRLPVGLKAEWISYVFACVECRRHDWLEEAFEERARWIGKCAIKDLVPECDAQKLFDSALFDRRCFECLLRHLPSRPDPRRMSSGIDRKACGEDVREDVNYFVGLGFLPLRRTSVDGPMAWCLLEDHLDALDSFHLSHCLRMALGWFGARPKGSTVAIVEILRTSVERYLKLSGCQDPEQRLPKFFRKCVSQNELLDFWNHPDRAEIVRLFRLPEGDACPDYGCVRCCRKTDPGFWDVHLPCLEAWPEVAIRGVHLIDVAPEAYFFYHAGLRLFAQDLMSFLPRWPPRDDMHGEVRRLGRAVAEKGSRDRRSDGETILVHAASIDDMDLIEALRPFWPQGCTTAQQVYRAVLA